MSHNKLFYKIIVVEIIFYLDYLLMKTGKKREE
jgi:hypothetical protein